MTEAVAKPVGAIRRVCHVGKWRGAFLVGRTPAEVHIGRALESLGCEVAAIDHRDYIPRGSYRLRNLASRWPAAGAVPRFGATILESIARRRLARAIARTQPDLVLLGHVETYVPGTIPEVRRRLKSRVIAAMWTFDIVTDRNEPRNGKSLWFVPLARDCDVAFVKERDHFGWMRERGINPVWLDQGVVDELPFGDGSIAREDLACDVAFLGNPHHPERIEFIRALGREVNVKVFTSDQEGWRRGGLDDPRPAVFDDDIPRLAASARICLAINNWNDIEGAWSDRVYWLLGSGAFCLAKRVKGIDAYFQEGVHLAYFDTPDECLAKIRHYLAHDDERERIRRAGFRHVHENHTYRHRCAELLDAVGKIAGRPPKAPRP